MAFVAEVLRIVDRVSAGDTLGPRVAILDVIHLGGNA